MNELLVRRGKATVPFSRGILARSLLNLGLDSTFAYDVAIRLYESLREEGLKLVTIQHLARIVSERLEMHAGPDVAARYEKMRLFKQSDRPLVLLVGGSTGSGKSSLATEVAHRLDITRIQSTDSVRHVMRVMISERLLPSIHRSSFEAWKVAERPVGSESKPSLGPFLEQVQHVSVAVEAVLERALQENLSTILEGVHLVPGLFERFARDPRLRLMHLVVHVEDESTHRQRFMDRGQGAQNRPGRRYLNNFSSIRAIQDHLLERARIVDIPCVENSNFDTAVHKVLGLLLDRVQDTNPIPQHQPTGVGENPAH